MISFKRTPRVLIRRNPPRDFPARELRQALPGLLAEGCTVRPKFTCQHCGERVHADLTNEFPRYMQCPECAEMHDFEASGGNYSVLCRLSDFDMANGDS